MTMGRVLKDYYALLHVQPGAPLEIIRASYRTLMQRLRAHPDLGGDSAAAAEINEAYAVLKDAAKRAAYDAERAAAAEPEHSERMHQAAPETETPADSSASPRSAHSGSRCAFCGWAPSSGDRHGDDRCGRCGSPLSRALPLIEPGDCTQRSVYRVTKDEPLRFFTDWQTLAGHPGVLVDLSLSGLRFASAEPLEAQQIVRIECAVLSAVVRVKRCQRGQELLFQIGAEFITVLFHRQRGSLVSIPV